MVWQQEGRLVGLEADVLILGMILLGLLTFAAMLAFVKLCDEV